MADPWPEQRSQALPQLSLTKSTSTGDDDWTSPQVHRCLPAETLSLRASNVPAPASAKAPLSLPAASLSEAKPGQAPSGLQRMTSGYVEDAPCLPSSSLLSTSAGAVAQPSTAAAPSEEYQPWAAVKSAPSAFDTEVPLPLTSSHVFGSKARIMKTTQDILQDAGVTVTAQAQDWSMACFHFDGHDACEFQVSLFSYGTAPQHFIMELKRTVGASASSAGGLLLGRLFHHTLTHLQQRGIAARASHGAPTSALLGTPAPGTAASVAAHKASLGGHVEDEGADLLSGLAGTASAADLLGSLQSKARSLPRWHSGSDLLGGHTRSFSARQEEAAATAATPGQSGSMMRALRNMRSQRQLPQADAVPPAARLESATETLQAGVPGLASTSAAGLDLEALSAAQAAGASLTAAQSKALWAPITAMLAHGGAPQKEEAVRVLAALSRSPANHDSIVKARLPVLLGDMMGLTHLAGQGATPGVPAPTPPTQRSTLQAPHALLAAGGKVYKAGRGLSRVGRALAVAMVANLTRSPVGMAAMRDTGILPALQRLWQEDKAEEGSAELAAAAAVAVAGAVDPATADLVAHMTGSDRPDTASDTGTVGDSEGEAEEGGGITLDVAPPPAPVPRAATTRAGSGQAGPPLGRSKSSPVTSLLSGVRSTWSSARAGVRAGVFKAFVMSKVEGVLSAARAVATGAPPASTTPLTSAPARDARPGQAHRPLQRAVSWSVAPRGVAAGQPVATIDGVGAHSPPAQGLAGVDLARELQALPPAPRVPAALTPASTGEAGLSDSTSPAAPRGGRQAVLA